MLTRIAYERNARSPLQYNERKVVQGKAEVIWAENFVKGHERLSLDDKLARFEQRTSLNERMESLPDNKGWRLCCRCLSTG